MELECEDPECRYFTVKVGEGNIGEHVASRPNDHEVPGGRGGGGGGGEDGNIHQFSRANTARFSGMNNAENICGC